MLSSRHVDSRHSITVSMTSVSMSSDLFILNHVSELKQQSWAHLYVAVSGAMKSVSFVIGNIISKSLLQRAWI